jgi:hypothetical protein
MAPRWYPILAGLVLFHVALLAAYGEALGLGSVIYFVFVIHVAIGGFWIINNREVDNRKFVRESILPPQTLAAFNVKHPSLSPAEIQEIWLCLKDFFQILLKTRRLPVAMPSAVASDLWHVLAADADGYSDFSKRAFGYHLGPLPAACLSDDFPTNVGLRRVWAYSCLAEGLKPSKPDQLPRLFTLDRKYKIPGGYIYRLDWSPAQQGDFCFSADAFNSPSFDGNTYGLGSEHYFKMPFTGKITNNGWVVDDQGDGKGGAGQDYEQVSIESRIWWWHLKQKVIRLFCSPQRI